MHEGVLFSLPPDGRWAARRIMATGRHLTPPPCSLPLASCVPGMLCQPSGREKLCSMLPQLGQSQKKKKMAFFQQPNHSERWQRGGLAIPTHTCAAWAMFHVQKASPLHAWVGIKGFLPCWATKKSIGMMVFVETLMKSSLLLINPSLGHAG